MFNVEPSMFFLAQSSLSDGFDKLQTLKTDISNCTSLYPKDYEYKSEVEEVKALITTVSSEASSLTRIVSELKDRLCSLDTGFALTYYSCAAQKYADITGSLTAEQQAYLEYNQKQYYEQLYKYLDANKDILTAEQKEIYEYLKQQKVFEKKYAELEKLYKEKEDNNGLLHPIIEGKIDDKIAALEKELGVYQNKWYEDIGYAITQTGSQWKSGVTSLINGEGFGELGNAVKQTVATGAVICNSARSGLSKLGEYVIDAVVAAGGSIAAGATWLFHDTWSDNDVAGKVMDSTLDFVRRDLVDEQNQNFYENNLIGKWINENSNLKYDSAGAKAIQSSTEFVGKVALATAATIVSGGAAAPLIIGAAYGVGKGAENYAQSVDRENGESYNYAEALLRSGVSGVAGAAEFYGYGQMGASVLGKSVTSNASTSFVKNFFAKDAIVDTGVTVSDHAVNVLFGDETWQDALKYGGIELAFASALNAFGAYQTTKYEVGVEKLRNDALDYYNSFRQPGGDLDWLDDVEFNKKLAKVDATAIEYEQKGIMKRDKFYEIWGTPKGERSDPSTYLPKKYIDNHLSKFESGASRVVDGDTYLKRVASNGGTVGNPNGYDVSGVHYNSSEFMSTRSNIDAVKVKASQSIDFEESVVVDLGLTNYELNNYKRTGIKRYDIDGKNLKKLNPRIPSGNEPGAFLFDWIPGGQTLGGGLEIVVDKFNLNDIGNKLSDFK